MPVALHFGVKRLNIENQLTSDCPAKESESNTISFNFTRSLLCDAYTATLEKVQYLNKSYVISLVTQLAFAMPIFLAFFRRLKLRILDLSLVDLRSDRKLSKDNANI